MELYEPGTVRNVTMYCHLALRQHHERRTSAVPFGDGKTEAQQSYVVGLVHTAGDWPGQSSNPDRAGEKSIGEEKKGGNQQVSIEGGFVLS